MKQKPYSINFNGSKWAILAYLLQESIFTRLLPAISEKIVIDLLVKIATKAPLCC